MWVHLLFEAGVQLGLAAEGCATDGRATTAVSLCNRPLAQEDVGRNLAATLGNTDTGRSRFNVSFGGAADAALDRYSNSSGPNRRRLSSACGEVGLSRPRSASQLSDVSSVGRKWSISTSLKERRKNSRLTSMLEESAAPEFSKAPYAASASSVILSLMTVSGVRMYCTFCMTCTQVWHAWQRITHAHCCLMPTESAAHPTEAATKDGPDGMVLTNPRIIVGEVAGIPDQLGRGSSTQQFVTHQIPTACAVRAPSTAQQVEQLLAKVDDWGFNIFDLEQATKVLALCCLWLACCSVVCCAAGGKLEHMLCRNCAQLGGGKTASSVLLVTAPQGHALSVLGFHVISRLGLVNELELDGWVLARCGKALARILSVA